MSAPTPHSLRTLVFQMHCIRVAACLAVLLAGSFCCAGQAEVLLDDSWTDGSRAETYLPDESAVWIGRVGDVTVSEGKLSTKMGESSQKIWTYFTADEPVTIEEGQTLTASISFVLRGALYDHTSRNFRVGLFHDPTDPRVQSDTNSDSGGDKSPWADATGYAVQVLLTNSEYPGSSPFDLGKRIGGNVSLLGSSAAYVKDSGGTAIGVELDTEYTLALTVKKVSDKQVDLSVSLSEGEEELASWSLSDNGSQLGSGPICDKFDMLSIRASDNATTADQIEFTNFKVTVGP